MCPTGACKKNATGICAQLATGVDPQQTYRTQHRPFVSTWCESSVSAGFPSATPAPATSIGCSGGCATCTCVASSQSARQDGRVQWCGKRRACCETRARSSAQAKRDTGQGIFVQRKAVGHCEAHHVHYHDRQLSLLSKRQHDSPAVPVLSSPITMSTSSEDPTNLRLSPFSYSHLRVLVLILHHATR